MHIYVRHAQPGLYISGYYKNLYFFLLFLCSISAAHISNWVIVDLSYILIVHFCFCCCWLLTRKYFFYICNGIMLPSLHVSTLYGTITLFMPADVPNFAVITEWFFIKMNWVYIHWVNAIFFCTILGYFWLHLIHSSGYPVSTHCYEVANFVAFFEFLRRWLLPHYLHACFAGIYVCVDDLLKLSLYLSFAIFNLSNSFTSVRLFMMPNWALWASTLLAQHNMLLLVISVFSCMFVSFLIISHNVSVT